jgi:hypothetical protein
MRWGGSALALPQKADWSVVALWLLGFGLVACLGLEGGGYDPLVHDQVGIAVWWLFLLGVAVGALPRRRPEGLAWVALGLLAAFALWTALSLNWTESGERTFAELARVSGYLGALALAVCACGHRGARPLVGGVAAGIVAVAIVALLSRLHPAWFPEANQTATFLTGNRERLSYPLNYWNGLGALIAIGLPLVLALASDARSLLARGLAAAALPALVLTAFFTFSRGGIAAAAIAVALFLALTSDRLPKLLVALAGGAGGALLVYAATRRDSLEDALLNEAAREQGDEMLAIALVVCLVVGLAAVGIALFARDGTRPRWSYVPPSRGRAATVAAVVLAAVAFLAVGGPGRASDAWAEFKQPSSPGEGAGRLSSAAGQSRYQYWSAAADQNATDPLTGTGAGTFELWWARNGENDDTVRDAHSLYMQVLGELGIVGLLLLAALLLTILLGGGWLTLRAAAEERPPLAAALAGCAAFALTAAVDWMWQLPVVPVAMLLLAAALLGPGWARRPAEPPAEPWPLPVPARIGCAFLSIVAIVVIAIPLASTSLLRESEAEAREGDLSGALEAARSARNVEPGAASPRLQEALVLEEMGDFDGAAEAARAAVERESTNWRPWLVLARLEARRGAAEEAVRAYRRARSLNPRSALFDR